MASNEETRKLLEKAVEQSQKTEQQLQEFKEDDNGGKWLDELRTKRRTGRLDDDEKEENKRLEEKEKRLEASKQKCLEHVQKLQRTLTAATTTRPGKDFVTRTLGT